MKARWLKLACFIIGFGATYSYSSLALELPPKSYIRTSMANLENVQSNGGSITNVGGINIVVEFFLRSWLSMSVGYRADFDVINGVVPLKGFDMSGRVYYLGTGTRKSFSEGAIQRSYKSRWAAYALGEFSQRSYLLPSTVPGEVLDGNLGIVSFGSGVEYALNQYFLLNVEYSLGVLSFSSRPDQVRLKTSNVLLGLGYLF